MEKSLKDAFYTKVVKAEGNALVSVELAVPIKLSGTIDEIYRLSELVNKTAKSSLGKETLEIAAEAGYTVGFADNLFCFGSCSDIKKTINLNSMFPDDRLIGTLAHEARHAGQFSRGASTSEVGNISVKSQIMLDRAMEADAQRTACITTYELKQDGDENSYKEFALKYPLITNPFEKAVENGGNVDLAAFKGWYDDDKMKSVYEDTFRYQIEYDLDDDTMFKKEYTSKEIVADLCFVKDGKSYFTENPKILEQGKFLDVEPKTMDFLKKFMKEREERDGFTPDKSINKIPVRASILSEEEKRKKRREEDLKRRQQKHLGSIINNSRQSH